MSKRIYVGAAALLALGAVAVAQVVPPQVSSIGATDLFQDIVGGQPAGGNQYVSSALLGNYGASLTGNNPENALIGGDFGENLWQRTTSVAIASPGTLAYTADRFAGWGGTNTPLTVSKQTGATDITPSYPASMRVLKPSGAGVVQICVAQEVETANSIRFQGVTAEIDFHAKAGAGFSSATSSLQVYILTGTGTDEGASNGAFSTNAGGGSSTPWTGASLLGGTAGYTVPISTAWNRYTVAAPIPATATEIMVSICYTPVGTGTSTDWFELAGVQLVPNSALTSVAGTAGAVLGVNDTRAKSFNRRLQPVETAMQQRFFYRLTETAAITPVAPCSAVDTTHTNCLVQFPVSMRTTPTMTYAAGFASPTSTTQATLGACSALITATTVTSTAANPLNVLVNCTATTIPAAGVASFLYSNNGSGLISASAEL